MDALPASLPLSELLERGAAWLTGREERAEWAYVWQALLEQQGSLPASLPLSELLERGAAWLTGREERVEWTYVWRALLAQMDALPASLPLSELLERGAAWLTGREERAEWTYVWRALLAQMDALPASLPLSELLERGAAWLTGREERAEWTYVWRALLAQMDALPASLPLSELLERGAAWLTGREERAEWAYVWRALLEQQGSLPASLPLSELLERGAAWLTGREERVEWTYVWQALLAQMDALPASLPLSELLERGVAWLTGREERAEWAHVWQDLLAQNDLLQASLSLSALLARGATWMKVRDDNVEEWSFVLERLLEQQYQDALFLDMAANWLTQASKKPEWPILSAKFIVAAPQHAASKIMAVMLAERIHAEPNRGHWFKTEGFTASLAAKEALPREVKAWLQALHTRREHPAWAEARRSFNEGLPLKGRIIVQNNSTAMNIELENGLRAYCYDSGLIKGRAYDFYVQQLNLSRDTLEVGLNKKVQLKIGENYDGLVKQYQLYGVFVTIDGQTGLLHKKQCSDWFAMVKRFPKGSQVCVKVLEILPKGPRLQYAGPELVSEFSQSLTVGEIYQAVISGMQEYGLFLRLGTRDGLLHLNKLPPNTDIMRQYSIGGQLNVQLIKIKDNGDLTFKLPD
jgi:predicted RNA-binding protein with RPS1 domain